MSETTTTTTPAPPPTTTSTTPTTSQTSTSTTTSQQPPTSTSTQPPPTSTTATQVTSPPPPPPSTGTTSARPSSSTSIAIITSGNVEVTQTIIVQPSVATSPAASSSSEPSPGFFENKGAVAGTFTAVGLVVLAAIGFIIFTVIRKRRQRKFDREVDEAAFEAASAPAPAFLDDDDDAYTQHNPGIQPNYTGLSGPQSVTTSNGGGGYYSDASHGTYGQQPMSPESYGMAELNHHHASIGPGQLFNAGDAAGYGGAAGAAGVGVARTRSMMGNPAAQNNQAPNNGFGLDDGNAPYAAFAGPTGGYGDNNRQHGYGTGNENPYAAAGVQRAASHGSSNGFNPYASHEPVPPVPNRSSPSGQPLVNPYEHQGSTPSPGPQGGMANPHSPREEEVSRNRVLSGGDFGGGATPEYALAPQHTAMSAEQGRWSDYQDDASPNETDEGPPLPRRDDEESDDEEEEERPKVFRVAND